MDTVVGVSRPRTSGAVLTKSGRKAYRGERKHWYVYYYDDDGRFRKRQISLAQVPYYGSLIRRRKSYVCSGCGKKFRSVKDSCPACGAKASRLKRGRSHLPALSASPAPPTQTHSANLAGSHR
jgi:DNA-directed RNA polymerase subunit RPC12/RpoP